MDHHFIARPRVVQAFQMTHEARGDSSTWPQWLHDAWLKDRHTEGSIWPADYPKSDGTDPLMIQPWGIGPGYLIGWNDWIVRHADGTFRLYNPSSFEHEFGSHGDADGRLYIGAASTDGPDARADALCGDCRAADEYQARVNAMDLAIRLVTSVGGKTPAEAATAAIQLARDIYAFTGSAAYIVTGGGDPLAVNVPPGEGG